MVSKHIVPNLSGAKLTIGRWALGPTVNLVSTGRPVALTEEEKGWTAEAWKLKPRQFGKLELEKRLLPVSALPAAARTAFKGSKSAFSKRYEAGRGARRRLRLRERGLPGRGLRPGHVPEGPGAGVRQGLLARQRHEARRHRTALPLRGGLSSGTRTRRWRARRRPRSCSTTRDR